MENYIKPIVLSFLFFNLSACLENKSSISGFEKTTIDQPLDAPISDDNSDAIDQPLDQVKDDVIEVVTESPDEIESEESANLDESKVEEDIIDAPVVTPNPVEEVVVEEQPAQEEPVIEQPVESSPETDQPVADEPTVEETPASEEEEVAVENPAAPEVEQPAEEPVQEEVAEEVAANPPAVVEEDREPAAEKDPVVEEPVADEPALEETPAPEVEQPAEEPAQEEVAEETPVQEEEPEGDSTPPAEAEEEVVVEEQPEPTEEEPVDPPASPEMQCAHKENYISNGSFEIVDDRKGMRGTRLSSIVDRGWDVFEKLPSENPGQDSWYTSDGAGIEVQGYHTVVKSLHGKRSVELDSHGRRTNSSMSQRVYLCKGKYVLKFLYYARTRAKDDNIITVRIDDKEIKSVNKKWNGKWKRVRKPFHVKESKYYTITFSAEGKENTLGGLVDHIRLEKKKRRAGVVTSLVSLGDSDNINSPLIKKEISSAIISKMVNFASRVDQPRIALVLDRGHHGESAKDFDLIKSILTEKYGSEKIKIIHGDLKLRDAEVVDLVYIVNPGYPLSSRVTANTIREIKKSGQIGVILSGDDISRGTNFNLSDITGAKYLNNGTQACGLRIDNNKGANKYRVKLKKHFFRAIHKKERTLFYGNDIDHVRIVKKGVRVFAKARVKGCCKKLPVIFGYKIKKEKKKCKLKRRRYRRSY